MDILKEQILRAKQLMGLIKEESPTNPVEGDDMIQQWVDTWNAWIFDRMMGGYGGQATVQSDLEDELKSKCPKVFEQLETSYYIMVPDGDPGRDWENIGLSDRDVNLASAGIDAWKEAGGDISTLERPEVNIKKDCPGYKSISRA